MGKKALLVSCELLVDLFKIGPARTYAVTAHGLPEDAAVVGCSMAWDRNPHMVVLVIESDEWPPELVNGVTLPEAEPVVCTLITEAADA